ncbi:Bidirectional sugar transporter SWEET [Quillaja saponaria]|uniref:Bidirectional sugar transporter SWEET n=1 Tax=Quillaja saponaria TaxID=32244 RepID=A0AAD7LDZ4_QUISA|nr:Bidirectional sugar transporter SWEET [Quillaja saponaria]
MADTETIRTIVGIIGNVISFGLFLSPIPTFVNIFKKKSVQDFKPDPYVATLLNCAMWSFYALPFVRPNSLLVLTINGTGFFIEIIYVTIFFIYSPWIKRRKIIIALIIEAIFMVVVVVITLNLFHTTKDRSMIIGILCIIFNVIMYASPLTVMRMVIKTKSVKYMPFMLSLANFANGVVWLIYALLKFDPYIAVPNGLGALSGLIQLILYATFYNTTKWDEDDNLPRELELSNA